MGCGGSKNCRPFTLGYQSRWRLWASCVRTLPKARGSSPRAERSWEERQRTNVQSKPLLDYAEQERNFQSKNGHIVCSQHGGMTESNERQDQIDKIKYFRRYCPVWGASSSSAGTGLSRQTLNFWQSTRIVSMAVRVTRSWYLCEKLRAFF